MPKSLMQDAIDHHVWATLRTIDACLPLTDEQLATTVPGTYGSILDTVRHLVGADASYLFALTRGATPVIEEDEMDLAELRTAMERHGAAWTSFLAENPDPDEVVIRRRDDGSETHAPIGIRLAQAVHHGTDHRSQVATALTSLAIEPPLIDLWDYAAEVDRVVEIPPSR
jgi:uncharacterized damage-inducible protein DinB